jgi:DNA replication protein DnaC
VPKICSSQCHQLGQNLDRVRARAADLPPRQLGALLACAIEQLRVAHGDGSYIKFLKTLAKASLIVLDDWGLTALSTQDRADLLEILDDRVNTGSTLIASQLPVDTWHSYLGEPTVADAILDRLVHHSHRIELKTQGESMRSHPPTPVSA